MKTWSSILFWSVISAAFIGPGTVTTAWRAGSGHGYSLLWALVFSTFTCVLLQEAAARLTIVTGLDLGRTLRERIRPAGILVGFGVVLGCVAYEAGNILGGSLGLAMLGLESPRATATVITVAAALLLGLGNTKLVARALGALVALMGLAFLVTAVRLGPALTELLRGSLVPRLPAEALPLTVGLIGTTVVPYNLFLGSGLARGHSLTRTRTSLVVAIGLGGFISMAIVVVAASVPESSSLDELGDALAAILGPWAGTLFAFGLFAAGATSAITAPLAAAYTARATWGGEEWAESSWRFRAVWIVTLVTGWAFGVSGVQAIPMIVLAQVFNGAILPAVAVFLLWSTNHPSLGDRRTPRAGNVAMSVVVLVTMVLGSSGFTRGVSRALGVDAPSVETTVTVGAVLAGVTLVFTWRSIRRIRQG